jgi:hypothetical protein
VRRAVAIAALGWLLAGAPCAALAQADTRYVVEELIVGVYADPLLAGDRLGEVRSAQAVELLATEGDAAQIRTEDGLEGWVRTTYLQSEQPLAPRLAALRAENEKLRKASAAATRVDPKTQSEIAELRTSLETANRRVAELQAGNRDRPADEVPVEVTRPARNDALRTSLLLLLVAAVAGGAGFYWGYRTLDRRIRAKYGGLKVY